MAFSPLRLFTACRRMYSIWPFTLRNSACAQPSRSSQSAGSIRRRNDFRSAIDYRLAFIICCIARNMFCPSDFFTCSVILVPLGKKAIMLTSQFSFIAAS